MNKLRFKNVHFTAARCVKTHFKMTRSSVSSWLLTSWRIDTSDTPGANTLAMSVCLTPDHGPRDTQIHTNLFSHRHSTNNCFLFFFIWQKFLLVNIWFIFQIWRLKRDRTLAKVSLFNDYLFVFLFISGAASLCAHPFKCSFKKAWTMLSVEMMGKALCWQRANKH